jgi:hypothetical protein
MGQFSISHASCSDIAFERSTADLFPARLLAQRNERNLKPAIDLASLLVSRKAPKPLGLMERHMPSKFALIAAILIVGSPLPIQAHDLYSHLVDSSGASCCDNKDCRPAPYRLTASGLRMFVDGRWLDVPIEKVQYRALPGDTGETGGGHWCGSAYEPDRGSLYITHCAILPPNSASAPYRDPPQ